MKIILLHKFIPAHCDSWGWKIKNTTLKLQRNFVKLNENKNAFSEFIWTHCAGDIIVGSVMFSERAWP